MDGDHIITGGQMHPLGAPQEGRMDHGRQAEHCRSPLLGDGLPGDGLHASNPAACGKGRGIHAG